MTVYSNLEWIKLAIYYASYLFFIAAPLCVWIMVARREAIVRAAAGMFLAGISILAYARFVEPRILLTAEHDVALPGCFERAGALRVAVFSDTHNGFFHNAMPIRRIARAVNAVRPDFVLAAGDFVYFPDPERFDEIFGAFADIKAPVFAVLGNHDVGLPGPDLSAPLTEAFGRYGVRLIDNETLDLSNSRFAIELVGLSDQWRDRQNLALLEPPSSAPRVVLTHNPATVRDMRPGMRADLLIAGHTHGGQIQLPFVTCWWWGLCGNIAYGLRTENATPIFTTSGTGMSGLPMRFGAPPRVDMLNISYNACPAG